ncbi:MAG: acetyltransferase [Anaerolineae bacterium]|uniref:acetyltransferase n=1 Tax=Thermanaerothrix sp. TaxID=2972675 RepID=UPI003C7C824C
MSKVVIIGAGGHAREVLDILLTCRASGEDVEPIGFIDENPQNHGRLLNGFPILGGFQWFEGVDRQEVRVICAVGTPQITRKLVIQAKSLGLHFTNAISPRSCISPYARLGEGVIIFPNVIVNTGVIIGDHITLNVAVTVSHDTTIGHFCNINPGAHLAGNVTIGEGCYIGMGANVIQGVRIGEWSIIGAGAVVINDIPPNATAVGVPAKVIKTREEGWHER